VATAPGRAQRLQRAQLLASAAVLGGFLYLYYLIFLEISEYRGTLAGLYENVVDGHADAPYQYRILVPRFVVWLHHLSGVAYRLVAVVVDGAALYGGAFAILGVLTALRRERLALGVALYIAFLGFGTTAYAKPESIVAFFAASLLALGFVRHEEKGAAVLVALAAFVLAGTRLDVLAALGVAYFVRWFWQRRRKDLVFAAALVVVAAGTTVALAAAYPDTRYPPGVPVLQLWHSIRPNNFVFPLLFLLPAIVPLWMLRGRIRETVGVELCALGAAVVAFSAEALVVARVEEVRLWFPFAGIIGCIGAVAWMSAGIEPGDP
jgi:hypothetical protein